MNELQALAADTQAHIYVINSLFDLWTTLSSFSNGFLIAASESDLSSHKETHEILKLTPSAISTITLQHGFECVGFLMNDHHQKQHGDGESIGFPRMSGQTAKPRPPKKFVRDRHPLGLGSEQAGTNLPSMRAQERALQIAPLLSRRRKTAR